MQAGDRGTLEGDMRGRRDVGPVGHNMKLTKFSMRAMGWTGHWRTGRWEEVPTPICYGVALERKVYT